VDWPALVSCDLCPAGANGLGSVWGCEVQPIGYIPQPTQDIESPDSRQGIRPDSGSEAAAE
jgi:hypothetical protein